MNILSFDVGGTFIKWGIIDGNVTIIKNGEISTPRTCFDDFLQSIGNIIEEVQDYQVGGLSFSLPGTMDSISGEIIHGGTLRYLDGLNFYKEIQNKFSLKVSIANDARCAAMAEMELGELKNIKNGLAYILGTGIGGAIIIDGKIYTGTSLYAGEFSLMIPKTLQDGKKLFSGDDLSVPILVKTVETQLGLQNLNGKTMMELVINGNSKAKEIYIDYVDRVVNNLLSLQFIFAPEKIVIGGGISQNKYFIDSINKKYEAFFGTIPLPKDMMHATISRCKFASKANLIGAYINYMNIN